MRSEKKFSHLALYRNYTLTSKIALVGLTLLTLSCAKKPGPSHSESDVPQPSDSMRPEVLMSYVESKIESEDIKYYSNRFEEFCERYTSLDENTKKKAIAAYATSIAFAESNLNSFTTYYETTLGFESIGLFSLSYVDNKNYGCNFSESDDKGKAEHEKSIVQTDKQVECFLKISRRVFGSPEKFSFLRTLAKNDKKAKANPKHLTIAQKMSVYWSVLRPANSGRKRFQKMKDQILPAECKN